MGVRNSICSIFAERYTSGMQLLFGPYQVLGLCYRNGAAYIRGPCRSVNNNCMAFSPDGKQLMSTADSKVVLRDLVTEVAGK
jgi:hypothetical protein